MVIFLPLITNFSFSGSPNNSIIGFGTRHIVLLAPSKVNFTKNSVSSFFHLVNNV